MTIVFVSNNYNHHERFFCEEMESLQDVEFFFIQTQPMREERIKMGWWLDTSYIPFVYNAYESKSNYDKALQICNSADVLILGSAPYEFIAERVKKNKLTFFYAERLFRRGLWHILYPPTFFTVLRRFIIPGNKSNFFMLCASGYTALDCHKIIAFRGKYLKWGHFIEVKHFNSVDSLLERGEKRTFKKISILWVGRLIKLKHPDMAVEVASRLKEKGYHYEMNFIGSGEMENALRSEVDKIGISGFVHFLGTMTPQKVRSYMEKSDIFLFTSDFQEGWGAVLGEALASGCAVVTSHGIGATPFLAKHKENALVYETDNVDSLFRNVKKLMDSEELRARLSKNAIETMQNIWNAKVGAERLYNAAKALLNGEAIPEYENGPISKASLLKNNWFKDDTV